MTRAQIKTLLDSHVARHETEATISETSPDPILIPRHYRTHESALIAALFSYGNVRAIMGFLKALDLSVLHEEEAVIKHTLSKAYYRFQTPEDVTALFIALRRLLTQGSLEAHFLSGYQKGHDVLEGIGALIRALDKAYPYESRGYRFLLGTAPDPANPAGSPLKRWNMFVRWMARNRTPDLGWWPSVDPARLIVPLDTHTFRVSRNLGLLTRKSCDLKAALALTKSLRRFDPVDPVKYDFALFRLGLEKGVR